MGSKMSIKKFKTTTYVVNKEEDQDEEKYKVKFIYEINDIIF
jgi:hypothetical protein